MTESTSGAPRFAGRRLLVGVAGGSGSGKSTVARDLAHRLGEERCTLLSFDHYYREQAGRTLEERARQNYDHPDSLDTGLFVEHLAALRGGRPVQVPRYDFATHARLPESDRVAPGEVVVVEGILLFAVPEVVGLLDLRVFLDVPEEVRYERRLRRDTVQRGRTAESVRRQFEETVAPMHDRFVQPSRAHADLVFRYGYTVAEAVRRIVDALGPGASR